jgi:hypothetical protein
MSYNYIPYSTLEHTLQKKLLPIPDLSDLSNKSNLFTHTVIHKDCLENEIEIETRLEDCDYEYIEYVNVYCIVKIQLFIDKYEHISYSRQINRRDSIQKYTNIKYIIFQVSIPIKIEYNDQYEDDVTEFDWDRKYWYVDNFLERMQQKMEFLTITFTEVKKELIEKVKAKNQDKQVKHIISLVTGTEINF